MTMKRMGITEILRRIWLFSANNIKSSVSFSKQPTQVIVEFNSSLPHIIVTQLGMYSGRALKRYAIEILSIFSIQSGKI